MELKDLSEMINSHKDVAVYGAGMFAKRVANCLTVMGIKLSCYIVTDKNRIPDMELDGIPIVGIHDLVASYIENAIIIVAVNERHFSTIKNTINHHFGEGKDNNVVYLTENQICELYRNCHPLKTENFLKDTEPTSRLYGNERGTPVDRYYIEKFLLEESKKIRTDDMRILEVGEDTYSRRFFSNSTYDILDYTKGMDLTVEGTIPENCYDVFIATQVFHQIYQVKAAINGARRLLKSGGVLLATVCGTIVKPARNDEYEHYWGFTVPAITNLMKEVFDGELQIQSYGNAAVATAFVQGVAAEELSMSVLEENDTDYPICISIFARKE